MIPTCLARLLSGAPALPLLDVLASEYLLGVLRQRVAGQDSRMQMQNSLEMLGSKQALRFRRRRCA